MSTNRIYRIVSGGQTGADTLKVMAELFSSGLWDMNGVGICVSSVTGNSPEPLDDELQTWQDRFNEIPLDDNHDLIWLSVEEQETFDRDGEMLAKKLFDFFKGSKTILYRSTKGTETKFEGKLLP